MKDTRIAVISLLAMIAVVWWHCYCASSIEHWFTHCFCVWSVPWFFFASGLLYKKSLRQRGLIELVRGKLISLVFVYCLHLIVLSWVGGVMRIAVGAGPVARLCGYFLLWQTFWIDVLLANLVRKCLPKVYGVLSGGR